MITKASSPRASPPKEERAKRRAARHSLSSFGTADEVSVKNESNLGRGEKAFQR
jgi:hypothetical protein